MFEGEEGDAKHTLPLITEFDGIEIGVLLSEF